LMVRVRLVVKMHLQVVVTVKVVMRLRHLCHRLHRLYILLNRLCVVKLLRNGKFSLTLRSDYTVDARR
jgi:hypothetical protein